MSEDKGVSKGASEGSPVYSLVMKGHLGKLEGVKGYAMPKGGGRRGKVRSFSSAARRRMLYTVAQCGGAVPIFITLTYGREWPDDPTTLNKHVDLFWKRLVYSHDRGGELAMIWKKEWQRRGAPHFHGLLYLADGSSPWVCKDWIAINWAQVTGDVSEAHVASGTRVEALRSSNGGKYYCAKYMGKEQSIPRGIKTGRMWGVLARKNLPVTLETLELSKRQVAAYRVIVSEYQSAQWARRQFPKSDWSHESPVDFDPESNEVVWEVDHNLLEVRKILMDEEEERQRRYLTAKPRAIQQHLMTEGNLLREMDELLEFVDKVPGSPRARLVDKMMADL